MPTRHCRISPLFVAAVSLLTAYAAHAAPGAATPAIVCDGCHGPGGRSAGPTVPSLAGQDPAYFVLAMQHFRSGKRPSTVMAPLARGLTDTDVRRMAAHYAQQTPTPQVAALDPASVKAGSALFFKYCKACHVDGRLWRLFHQYRAYEKDCNKSCHVNYGAEAGDAVPLIGGQWIEYLQMEMAAFKDGTRPMSPRKAKAFESLSPADLDAAAAFYASQTDLKR